MVQQQHGLIGALIDNNLAKLFQRDYTAQCLVHGRQCEFYYKVTNIGKAGSDGRGRLVLFVAGVTCLDVSRMGARRRKSGQHWVALKLFYAERKVKQEDLGILECTEDFDFDEAEAELGHLYDMTRLVWSPQDMGMFVNRTRCFVLLHLRSSVAFTSDVEAFKSLFGRELPTADCPAAAEMGDQFLCMPPADVERALEAQASELGLAPPFDWHDALTGWFRFKLKGYEDIRKLKLEAELQRPISHDDFLACDAGPCLSDLTQDATVDRGREGSSVPTLLQSSFIWSRVRARPL